MGGWAGVFLGHWCAECYKQHLNIFWILRLETPSRQTKKPFTSDGRSPTIPWIYHTSLIWHLLQRCPCVSVIKMTSHCNVLSQFLRISLRFSLFVILVHRTAGFGVSEPWQRFPTIILPLDKHHTNKNKTQKTMAQIISAHSVNAKHTQKKQV